MDAVKSLKETSRTSGSNTSSPRSSIHKRPSKVQASSEAESALQEIPIGNTTIDASTDVPITKLSTVMTNRVLLQDDLKGKLTDEKFYDILTRLEQVEFKLNSETGEANQPLPTVAALKQKRVDGDTLEMQPTTGEGKTDQSVVFLREFCIGQHGTIVSAFKKLYTVLLLGSIALSGIAKFAELNDGASPAVYYSVVAVSIIYRLMDLIALLLDIEDNSLRVVRDRCILHQDLAHAMTNPPKGRE